MFLLKASYPHKLKNARGGVAYLSDSPETVNQGKAVFAENCAAYHSSKAPQPPVAANPAACIGSGYLDCWNRYWEWTRTTDFKQQMRQIVSADDFLDNNYMSNDTRVPVTLLQTNACAPLATNAIAGNIWDNFSSKTYKDLPSVGTITVVNPRRRCKALISSRNRAASSKCSSRAASCIWSSSCWISCASSARSSSRSL